MDVGIQIAIFSKAYVTTGPTISIVLVNVTITTPVMTVGGASTDTMERVVITLK